jgi:P4 family phage/plasmid primase-like protien
MQGNTHSHNGQPASATNGHAGRSNKGPALKVHLGDKGPSVIYPALVSDADWTELHQRCEQADGHVMLDIVNLPKWPDDRRYALLTLAKSLGERCRLRVDKHTYNDPFEAILAAMPGPKPMKAHQQGLRATMEAAAVFYPDMPDQAAKRINDRLAEVGAAKMNHPNLVKQIREIAGAVQGDKQLDAHAAAQAFLAHLTEAGETDANQPVLRYFQADFYTWSGNAWERQEDENFAAQVMGFLQSLEISNLTERFSRDVLAHMRGMVNLKCWAESMPFLVVSEDPLRVQHPYLIVFQNGAIDLDAVIAGKAPKLKTVDSSYFNEVVLPYDYDPAANCPIWTQTIKGILPVTGDGDKRRLVLQEFMGYSLLPDCRFQKMLAAIGEGGNGKTTVMKTWQAMLGTANFSSVPLEVLGNEHRQFSLKGKLTNFSAEFPYLGRVNEGLLKSLVSGEEIEVNRKFKSPVKIRPYAKLVVHANEMPQIQDPTEGTWDRLIAMPFKEHIRDTDKDDKQRPEKLVAELPGIFNWALKGLKRLLNQGHFTYCAECAAFLAQHRTECDTVRQFLSDCCQKDSKRETYSEPLYEVYKLYTENTGRKPLALPHFGRRMKAMKWVKGRASDPSRKPVYKGLCMSSNGEDYVERWKKLAKQSDVDITHQAGNK